MTTYSVEPDGYGDTALWRAESDEDQRPIAVATVINGQTKAIEDDHGVVFRAAAAVLAPDDSLILAMAEAMFTEAGGHSWHAADLSVRDLWIGAAYSALRHIRAHVEEGP